MSSNLLYNMKNLKKGQQIYLKLLEDDEYEGVVHHINDDGTRIALNPVKDLSTGTVHNYMQYFTINEIRDLKVVDATSDIKTNKNLTKNLIKHKKEPTNILTSNNNEDKLKKGQKIVIKLAENDQYEGVVHHFNDDCTRIALNSVKDLSTGTINNYIQYFMINEIRNLKIINATPENRTKEVQTKNLEFKKIQKREPKYAIASSSDEESENSIAPLQKKCNLNLSKNHIEHLQNVQNRVTYIISKDEYRKAIEILKKCQVISLDAKYVEPSPRSLISLLIIANWYEVYVFDIKLIGYTFAFSQGLSFLLQSDIIKIVHSGVQLNDALIHRHRVCMRKILDTQILDVAIRYQKDSMSCQYKLRTLTECMSEYLNAPRTFLNNTEFDWNRRPIDIESELVGNLLKRVLYLLPLKNCMQQVLNKDLHLKTNNLMKVMSEMDPGQAFYNVNRSEHFLENTSTSSTSSS